jgi:hypothetical protein
LIIELNDLNKYFEKFNINTGNSTTMRNYLLDLKGAVLTPETNSKATNSKATNSKATNSKASIIRSTRSAKSVRNGSKTKTKLSRYTRKSRK